jgi:hypothetical protein
MTMTISSAVSFVNGDDLDAGAVGLRGCDPDRRR